MRRDLPERILFFVAVAFILGIVAVGVTEVFLRMIVMWRWAFS
jgi:hypothetical protein